MFVSFMCLFYLFYAYVSWFFGFGLIGLGLFVWFFFEESKKGW